MSDWHDIVLAVGSMILILALLPTVFSSHKPAALTAFLTGTILSTFAFTYFSLELYYAAATTAITSLLWFVILVQILSRRRADSRKKL